MAGKVWKRDCAKTLELDFYHYPVFKMSANVYCKHVHVISLRSDW